MGFLRNKTVKDGWTAVVFGTDRIAVADVTRRRDARPRVRACDSFAREGSDHDVLRRLKSGRRVGSGHCATLLWHGQYQLVQVDAPDNLPPEAPREELREAMRWRVKELVDFPIEQAGIDVLTVPPAGSRGRQLWVVVASHDALRPRVQLFQDVQAHLEVIDIPELAQRNLASLFEEPNRGLALVAFDNREKGGGRLTITYQGELYMTRYIDVGGPELAVPHAEALHERVLLDIQRSLDNFDRNYSAIPLTRLLVGPLPGGTEFINYLRGNLSLPVDTADLTSVLDCEAVPRLTEAALQADAWLAIGAALREQ